MAAGHFSRMGEQLLQKIELADLQVTKTEFQSAAYRGNQDINGTSRAMSDRSVLIDKYNYEYAAVELSKADFLQLYLSGWKHQRLIKEIKDFHSREDPVLLEKAVELMERLGLENRK